MINSLPIAEIQGHILSSYRNCKERFSKLVNNLTEAKLRAQQLQEWLSSATAEYQFADDIAEPPKLVMKLQLIEDAIADLPSDAESKRQSMQNSLRNGQFSSPWMDRRAFKTGTRSTSTPIQGRYFKIEERPNQVRRNSIAQVNSWLPLLKPHWLPNKRNQQR